MPLVLLATALALLSALGAVLPLAAASAAELPDGRNYEQVTPEEKLGTEAYQPPVVSSFAYKERHSIYSNTKTEYTFQAAADGSGIAYVAGPTVGGSENEGFFGGNEYLATRNAAGDWSTRVLSPEGVPSAIFQAFTPNLATAFVNSMEPLSTAAPGFGEVPVNASGNYDVLYSMDTVGSEYDPLFSSRPPYRSVERFGTAPNTYRRPILESNSGRASRLGFLAFEGASANATHLLLAANDALTEASEGRPAAEGGAAAEFEKENNLYESVDGKLRLVNVLPNGTTHADAGFGNGSPIFTHVISADGSRIFWTDLSTGHIYMREDGTKTVEISPAGTYQTATANGSTVFYVNGELYAYDVEDATTADLTPGVAVEKVLGASENGEFVYYVTSAKELMLWHDGVTTSIAEVSPGRAEVTADGQSMVFVASEVVNEPQRLDVYDAETETLYCASCTSQGELGVLPMTNAENVYQPRWITANGAHVFFITTEGLVPQDTNEEQDVYEWERPGTGGCAESTGCVYLLSGGTSTDHSGFLDASESGEDVFIVTRANLVAGDEDGLFDVYDVRVGRRSPTAPACTGTGCQGVPPAAPIFATPPTTAFEGVGNLTPKPARAQGVKRASKRKTEASRRRKLRAALKSCQRRHADNRRARRMCKHRARQSHGAKAAKARRGFAAGHRHHNGEDR